MNTGYLIHQAERGHSYAEQREIDRRTGELAAATSRRWRSIVQLLAASVPKHNLAIREHSLQEPCQQVRC
jgi:hypothetical protein